MPTLNITVDCQLVINRYQTTDLLIIEQRIREDFENPLPYNNKQQPCTLSKEEIFKMAVDAVMEMTDSMGNPYFSRQLHWQAVYRNAVDFGLAINGDYKGFERFVERLGLNRYRVPFSYDDLKTADEGVFMLPVKDWTYEKYIERNMKKKSRQFTERYDIAKLLRMILLQYFPVKM